jgi:hypothetical protein
VKRADVELTVIDPPIDALLCDMHRYGWNAPKSVQRRTPEWRRLERDRPRLARFAGPVRLSW